MIHFMTASTKLTLYNSFQTRPVAIAVSAIITSNVWHATKRAALVRNTLKFKKKNKFKSKWNWTKYARLGYTCYVCAIVYIATSGAAGCAHDKQRRSDNYRRHANCGQHIRCLSFMSRLIASPQIYLDEPEHFQMLKKAKEQMTLY